MEFNLGELLEGLAGKSGILTKLSELEKKSIKQILALVKKEKDPKIKKMMESALWHKEWEVLQKTCEKYHFMEETDACWIAKIYPKHRPSPEREKVGYIAHLREKGLFLTEDQFKGLKKWVSKN